MTLLRDILYACVLMYMYFSPSFHKSVHCTLIIRPQNVSAVGTENVTLHCSQNGPKGRITWITINPGSSERKYIYDGNNLDASVSSYINVSDRDDGNCILTIAASVAAAKKYICKDATDGDEASADLFVMKDYLKFDAEANTCSGSVSVNCPVISAGNWAPVVECDRKNEQNRFLKLQGSKTIETNLSEVRTRWTFESRNESHEINCSIEFPNTARRRETTVAYRPPKSRPDFGYVPYGLTIAILTITILTIIIAVAPLAVLVGLILKVRSDVKNNGKSLICGYVVTLDKYYLIVNQATGLVLDGCNPCHGSHVVLSQRHGGPSQQWRDDPCSGTIRCRQNDLCLDVESCELGGHVVLHPYQRRDGDQQWMRTCTCDEIVSRSDCNMVLAVSECGGKVVKASKQCAQNYRWRFEHCAF